MLNGVSNSITMRSQKHFLTACKAIISIYLLIFSFNLVDLHLF